MADDEDHGVVQCFALIEELSRTLCVDANRFSGWCSNVYPRQRLLVRHQPICAAYAGSTQSTAQGNAMEYPEGSEGHRRPMVAPRFTW
jgi:hypothetical protein